MRSSAVAVEIVRLWAPDNLRRVAPGVALCAVIAAIAFVADKQNFLRFGAVWIPPLILTLVIGMALQPLSDRAGAEARHRVRRPHPAARRRGALRRAADLRASSSTAARCRC